MCCIHSSSVFAFRLILNSQLFLFLTGGYSAKAKEPILPYYLPWFELSLPSLRLAELGMLIPLPVLNNKCTSNCVWLQRFY